MIDFDEMKITVSAVDGQFVCDKVTIKIEVNNTKKYIYGVDFNYLEQCLKLLGLGIISTKTTGYRLKDFFSLPNKIDWDF